MEHVFYHANCMDGFGSAWAHYSLHGGGNGKIGKERTSNRPERTIKYHAINYGEKLYFNETQVTTKDHVTFLDFCPPLDDLEKLIFICKSVTLIDHHPNSVEICDKIRDKYSNFKYLVSDGMNSGCVLTWNYYVHDVNENPAPQFLRHIEDRDLWKFELEDTEYFHAGASSLPRTFPTWDTLEINEVLNDVLTSGAAVVTYRNSIVESICRDAYVQEYKDQYVMIVQCPPMIASEVGSALNKKYKESPFAIMFCVNYDRVQYSLRGKDKIDLNKVAGEFGGGGHPNAAGFTTKLIDSHLMMGKEFFS